MPGELHQRRAHCSGSAVDKDLFPARKLCSSEKIERRGSSEGKRGRFVVAEIGRLLHDRAVLPHAPVFRVTTQAGPRKREDLVAGLELLYVLPHRLDLPGELRSQDGLPRFRDPEKQAPHQTEARRHLETSRPPIARRYRGRVDPYQDFVVLGCRLFHLPELDNVGRPIPFVHRRFHKPPFVCSASLIFSTARYHTASAVEQKREVSSAEL